MNVEEGDSFYLMTTPLHPNVGINLDSNETEALPNQCRTSSWETWPMWEQVRKNCPHPEMQLCRFSVLTSQVAT